MRYGTAASDPAMVPRRQTPRRHAGCPSCWKWQNFVLRGKGENFPPSTPPFFEEAGENSLCRLFCDMPFLTGNVAAGNRQLLSLEALSSADST